MKLIIEKNPEKRLTPKEKQSRVGKGFIYHQSSQPFYRVKILLKNLETEPELYVNKIEKRVYQIPQLISFLKRFEELKKGIIWIHGGAVAERPEKGILFGGQQDIGKTTLSYLLAKKGCYLLGDDVIKLSRDGLIFRVQERGGIFPHPKNLRELPLSLSEKIRGWFKYYFIRYPFLNKFVYPNLQVDYRKIGKFLDQASLKKIYVLEKGSPRVQPINQITAERKILASSLDLFFPEGFPKRLFYNYCSVNDISPTIFEEKYKEILSSAFKGKECFVISGWSPFDFYQLFLEHERK